MTAEKQPEQGEKKFTRSIWQALGKRLSESRTATWLDRLIDLAVFTGEQNRLPQPDGVTHREVALARWLDEQRAASRDGTLDSDRRARLDDIAPEWEDDGSNWEAAFEAVVAFRKKHGDNPSKHGGAAGEASLSRWLVSQRLAARRRTLPPERIVALDEALDEWDHSTARDVWRERLKSLKVFLDEHDCLPERNVEDAAEQLLSAWLTYQRESDRKGTLHGAHAAALDKTIPGWREEWTERLEALETFQAEHGRLPATSDQLRSETSLRRWLDSQRAAARKNALSGERRAELDRAALGWDKGPETAWDARLIDVMAFRDKHGRLPHPKSEDGHEASLGAWLANRRRAERDGTLSSERRAELDKAVPEWAIQDSALGRPIDASELADSEGTLEVDPTAPLDAWLAAQRAAAREPGSGEITNLDESWNTSLEGVKAFVAQHDRLPKPQGTLDGEANLGAWLISQRTSARRGTLNPECRDALDAAAADWNRPVSGE